jgi:hypothetical protein
MNRKSGPLEWTQFPGGGLNEMLAPTALQANFLGWQTLGVKAAAPGKAGQFRF